MENKQGKKVQFIDNEWGDLAPKYKFPLSKESLAYLHSEEFNQTYATQEKLGAFYSKSQTSFRLWAPTAKQVEVLIFDGQYSEEGVAYPMTLGERGVFGLDLPGDWLYKAYVYRLVFEDYDQAVITVDPYAYSTTVNGKRTVILDLGLLEPRGWGKRMPAFGNPVDAVIYELSIRDFTSSEDSGISNKGLFLGLTEEGTRNLDNDATGLDYLAELGVTHVQLMPLFDFETIDERASSDHHYNWGYDPVNYNVPEGSYVTNAFNPELRIRELRSMIQALHDRGIRVIMDVVYNHVYKPARQALGNTVPGYFFRYDAEGLLANGSGCGNETASDQPMMRKYIVDSILHWAQDFAIDGFRFDLMGLHDVETMTAIRQALDQIDPSIIMLGEGWNMGNILPEEKRAIQKNAHLLPGIAYFNDEIRDSLKGKEFGDPGAKGFISAKPLLEEWLYKNHIGGPDFPADKGTYLSPNQLVQYVEVHDGFTMFDKLQISLPGEKPEILRKRHLLASSLVLLSQGIPFLHSGQEFFRTKYGVDNSYASPLAINKINWTRRSIYKDAVDYIKGLIALRKQEPAFRQVSYQDILASTQAVKLDYHNIAYWLDNGHDRFLVVFNALDHYVDYDLDGAAYQVLVENQRVDLENPRIHQAQSIRVDAFSCMVLKKVQ